LWQISSRIAVVSGDDKLCRRRHDFGRTLSETLINVDLTLFPSEGHLVYLSRWSEILGRLSR
jgi:hypothetical protein